LSESIAEYGLVNTIQLVGAVALRRVAPRLGRTGPTVPGVPKPHEAADPPLMTIVAVVKDADQRLPFVLSRLQRRRFDRWECVVVDDASQDRTLEVAQRFARGDHRFRVLANRRRVGTHQSEAVGKKHATTDAVLSLEELEAWANRLPGARSRALHRRKSSGADPASPTSSAATSPADGCDGGVDVVVAWPEEVQASTQTVGDAVILVAEAEYHVAEFGPLAQELRRRGRRVEFMAAPRTGRSTRYAIGRYADRILDFDPDGIASASAIVTLNDWGRCRALVERARSTGIPTFAKVEGVQDFDDVDTGRQRQPYRSSEFVLAQGTNDVRALPDQNCLIVGSERLERIWRNPVAPRNERALVNVNFTYDVLVDERERWLGMVGRALDEIGLPGLVSRHPADRGDVGAMVVSRKPFRFDASEGGVLISRFSTVPFEAMARGMEFVYFNPHGERVPTFAEPAGAFPIARTVDELSQALRRRDLCTPIQRRTRYETFFRAQVDMVDGRRSAERTADVIDDVLSSRERRST
jgi:hypothetical protein